MKDYLNTFGNVSSSGSDNILDFGKNDYGDTLHTGIAVRDLVVVFSATADIAASDTGVAVGLTECDTEGGTYTSLVQGPTIKTAIAKGGHVSIAFPFEHKRYVKATCTSGAFNAWIERGEIG